MIGFIRSPDRFTVTLEMAGLPKAITITAITYPRKRWFLEIVGTRMVLSPASSHFNLLRAVVHNQEFYGPNTDLFIPERWLTLYGQIYDSLYLTNPSAHGCRQMRTDAHGCTWMCMGAHQFLCFYVFLTHLSHLPAPYPGTEHCPSYSAILLIISIFVGSLYSLRLHFFLLDA
ncbi:hypothetical protein DFH08DRAFT_826361 [Mycena albidolilacea]|uniref:Uncharacterized protein n=1 Tax=Mycena albidolilacea TaxID=1033008 RepID=A0AAD6Z0H7_9AGAR|nr:hypothetical protein DFH08DRAFT_826361 [Mycena albidolilacea]